MAKIFEDEFMDMQSNIVSLCLELLEGKKVEKIYAYGSIEGKSISFNAFCKINGDVKTLNQIGLNSDIVWQFLDLGIADLQEIKKVCNKYEQPIPNELKMIYNVSTGKYHANYKYEEVCSVKTGIASSEVFMDWIDEVKKEK
jgi:hypothetical protein